MPYPRRQKYNAKPTEFDGKKYPSKSEARRAEELAGMLQRGEVALVLEQVPVFLQRAFADSIRYVVDFFVIGRDGSWWFEDVKGMKTPVFKLKIKMWKSHGPGPLRLLTGRKSGWYTETVLPDHMEPS